jgi:hypothetical protein
VKGGKSVKVEEWREKIGGGDEERKGGNLEGREAKASSTPNRRTTGVLKVCNSASSPIGQPAAVLMFVSPPLNAPLPCPCPCPSVCI